MTTRYHVYITVEPEEYRELRQAMIAEGGSLTEFFTRYARKYLAQKRRELAGFSGTGEEAENKSHEGD